MDQAIGNPAGQFDDRLPGPAAKAAPTGQSATGSADVEESMEQKHVYAGREWSTNHSLNIRVSIPLGVGRYYVTLVAGKERRARARIALDRRQNPLDTPGNVLFLALIVTIAAAGGIAFLYLLLAHLFGWSGRLVL
ncbi:MAG: hypothetical protein ACR2RF_15180 [Geminicoccaceae bacterium]